MTSNPLFCSQSQLLKKNLRFKIARLEAGFQRQCDLASAAGLAEHNIARIENGRWNPPAEVKARLAEILRKSTFEVFQ
jgi:DNA-binding XRE family transcriptional regulator